VTLSELRDYQTPPWSKIIYKENTDKGMGTDWLLLLEFKPE